MKVVGYARVSTDLQKEKETIKTQIELIERLCEAQGHALVEIFCDDGVSGTLPLDARPAGRRLLAAARQGSFEGIVVYKADRIGRDVLVNEMAARELHDHLGIVFLGISEQIDLATPIGRAMFTFQSAIGRLERENTLQRSWDATLRLAREGVWLGGIVPFGYSVEGKDARLKISDEPIPDLEMSEADVVRRVFQLAGDEGKSCMAIAAHLNDLGVPTVYTRENREVLRNRRKQRTMGVWRHGRVRAILVQTTYKGVHFWGKNTYRKTAWKGARNANGSASTTDTSKTNRAGEKNSTILSAQPYEPVEREVPALVDEKLWERAQETLRRNRLVRPDVERRRYLLRGLVKCSLCGLSYVGTVNKGRLTKYLPPEELENAEVHNGQVLQGYYVCNGKNGTHQCYTPDGQRCCSASVHAHALEMLIWRDIAAFLTNPGALLDLLRESLQEQTVDTSDIARQQQGMERSLAAKEDERASLLRLYRRGAITDADLDRQLREIGEEEVSLRDALERLKGDRNGAEANRRSLASATDLLSRLRAQLNGNLSWETRRKIVEVLVAGIEIESFARKPKQPKPPAPKVTVRYIFDAEHLPPVSSSTSVSASTPVAPEEVESAPSPNGKEAISGCTLVAVEEVSEAVHGQSDLGDAAHSLDSKGSNEFLFHNPHFHIRDDSCDLHETSNDLIVASTVSSDSQAANCGGQGLEALISWKRAGNFKDCWAREIVT